MRACTFSLLLHRWPGALLFGLFLVGAAYAQITPSQDAYTNTLYPTTNYGTATTFGVVNTATSIQTAYIQFDLSSLPAGYTSANITKATLKLFVNTVPTAGSFNIDYVNGTWKEKTITSSVAPALGSTILASVPLTSANAKNYLLLDLTSVVGAWLDSTQANYGIALVANSPLSATFDSKENTAQSHPAELDIVFAGSGGSTITGVLTGAGSGLTGGGTSGTLNLSLLKSCASGQVLTWNGSAWTCTSLSGGGTITGVIAGADLTGGGYNGNVTLNLDTTKVPLLAAANSFGANQSITANSGSAGLLLTNSGSGVGLQASSRTASGVAGYANATTGAPSGVFGQTQASGGYGVYGQALATSGATTGVEGEVYSASGTAVLFVNHAAGKLLRGLNNTAEVFSVDGGGNLSGGNVTITGAGKGLTFPNGSKQTTASFGTVTSVGSGTGLTGGPITTSGTLSIDTTKVPVLAAANTFTGNQTVQGNVTASGQLISTATTGQPLVVNSTTQVANLNATYLGGWLSSSYALLQNANNFTGAQTITAPGTALAATSQGAGGTAVYGTGTYGVYGVGTTDLVHLSTGVYGYGTGHGVAGYSNYGYSAVFGSGTIGVEGTGPTGVMGESTTTDGVGVWGISNIGGTTPIGVYGQGSSSVGYGVFGNAATGVYGTGNPNGVWGNSDSSGGNGVIGEANNGSVAYGVWGKSTSGYAGYFSGNVYVNGTLSAANKQFKIDHPLDPANKYLVHSSVESSEMMNIYTGNVTTDGEGEATVQLPDWFEALNTDFRYQLTVIGQFAQAIVARKIANNQFTIRTSAPNVEVSWQVTGVRQDAYAKAHPLVVEEQKEELLRLLHPSGTAWRSAGEADRVGAPSRNDETDERGATGSAASGGQACRATGGCPAVQISVR